MKGRRHRWFEVASVQGFEPAESNGDYSALAKGRASPQRCQLFTKARSVAEMRKRPFWDSVRDRRSGGVEFNRSGDKTIQSPLQAHEQVWKSQI